MSFSICSSLNILLHVFLRSSLLHNSQQITPSHSQVHLSSFYFPVLAHLQKDKNAGYAKLKTLLSQSVCPSVHPLSHSQCQAKQSHSLQDTGLKKKSISIWQPRAAPQHTSLRANTSLWHEEETLGHMPECSCQSCSGGMPDFFFFNIYFYRITERKCQGLLWPLSLEAPLLPSRLHCLCSNEYLNRAINISKCIHPNKKSTTIREMRQPGPGLLSVLPLWLPYSLPFPGSTSLQHS